MWSIKQRWIIYIFGVLLFVIFIPNPSLGMVIGFVIGMVFAVMLLEAIELLVFKKKGSETK